MFRLIAVLVVCGACRPPSAALRPVPTGSCLPLDGAYRTALQLATEGDAAYWAETGWERNPLNVLRRTRRIVRLDLRTATTTTALDGVDSPFRVLPGGGLIALRADQSSFTVARPGEVPWDVVLADDAGAVTNLAVDATGDRVAIGHRTGALEVFRLSDRHRVRLPVTGWLLYMDGTYVAYSHGDDRTVWEIAPGQPSPRELGKLPGEGWFTSGRRVFYIKGDQLGIWQRGRPVEVLTSDPATIWGYTAHGFVTNDAAPSEATLFVGDARWRLPGLLGGGRYAGAVRLGDGRFLALVAHNTRFDAGVDDRDERDVCIVPAAGTVELPTRTMPGAYAALTEVAVATAAALAKPDMYAFDLTEDREPTLAFYLPGNGGDPAAMLAKLGEAERLLGDRLPHEVRVAIHWENDRRYALSWWSYRMERRRADAGNRTARVEREGDASLVVARTRVAATDRSVGCTGRVTNRSDRPLALKVSCGGEWFRVRPATLRRGQTGMWSATAAIPDGADADAARDRSHELRTLDDDMVIWADPDADARAAADLARATAVGARSGLEPVEWSWRGGTAPVHVDAFAPAGFADGTDADRAASAAAAVAALADWIPAAVGAPPTTPVELAIERDGARWRYRDGAVEVVDD